MNKFTDKYRLREFFKNKILENLKKIDAKSPSERKVIYDAAYKALQAVHDSRMRMDESDKNTQIKLLQETIKNIETTNFQLEISNNTCSLFHEITSKNRILPVSLFFITTSIILLLIYGVSQDYHQINDLENDLEYELTNKNLLFKKMKKRGKESNSSLKKVKNGIEYKILNDDNNKPNALDIILQEPEVQQLKSTKQKIALIIQLQKSSDMEMDVVFLLSGLGRRVKKKLRIIDNNVNSYFIIANDGESKKNAKFVNLRILIPQKKSKNFTNPAIIIREISLELL